MGTTPAGPKRYTLFKQAIGSTQTKLGFHGMIALAVYARTEDVKSGSFVPYEGANSKVNQGVSLGVAKAGNKVRTDGGTETDVPWGRWGRLAGEIGLLALS